LSQPQSGVALVHQRQAQALARLKANQFTPASQVLSDGSYLVTLHPVGFPPVQVRVIEYRIEPHTAERLAEFPASQTSNHPDPRQLHRLVTTLLDPLQAPALELINCYHERWEIEVCIDEQKNHLRLSGQPLRSKEPGLVRQELYGLLLAHYGRSAGGCINPPARPTWTPIASASRTLSRS